MPSNEMEKIDEENHVFAKLYKDPLIIANPGRVFYFSRHGESMNNLTGKIGGNANLSPNGQKYATMLANYFNQLKPKDLQVLILILNFFQTCLKMDFFSRFGTVSL